MDISAIEQHGDLVTASCFITTDKADNQITGFFVGAMARARDLSMREVGGRGPSPAYAVVAPDDPDAMSRHCREAKEAGIPLIFDPSFQVIAMDGPTLREASEGAHAVVLNDYEHEVLKEKVGLSDEELLGLAAMWVVTYGEEGSQVLRSGRDPVVIPAAPVSEVVDPTGAGDAFRGGFVSGLLRGADLGVCGRMGSVAASYAIEHYGTQNHRYTREEFWQRYRDAYDGSAEAAVG